MSDTTHDARPDRPADGRHDELPEMQTGGPGAPEGPFPLDDPEYRRLERQTDEGAQELKPRLREQELVLTGAPWPEGELGETMIVNMGPQHPSTHGVLRIMIELDAEEVVRSKAVIGYLHTGMEKTGEELTFVQGPTNVTRMDYASPLSNELVYCMAVERLLDIAAHRLGIDAAEIRRRNLLPPEALPFDTGIRSVDGAVRFDSGDFVQALDGALAALDYADWRQAQATA